MIHLTCQYCFALIQLKANTTLMDSMSATERYEDDIRKAIQLYRIAKEDGSLEATKAMLGAGIGSGILPDGNPLGLHLVMFQPTLMGQGTLEQQAKWLGGAWNLDFIGKEPSLDLGPKPVLVDTFPCFLHVKELTLRRNWDTELSSEDWRPRPPTIQRPKSLCCTRPP